ncbi:MAG TPA: hypothetical protein VMG82_26360 [Candidatus Sulfotelmatobacter sp.]|nr:hypothetical protein [Candidatus Sulfotelmatobacter sp.]
MSAAQATALALERSNGSKQRPSTLTFSITIFLSAFLLFQVQLIAGKFMLPRFGGSPSVWNTCLLVFQILLLGGYAYAHFLSTRVSGKLQGIVHLALLASSITVIAVLAYRWRSPITPGGNWTPGDNSDPIWQVIRLLGTSVGIPFLALSTTGPLLQKWFSRMHVGSPYRLYALSNLGSLLGLVTYPFLFERFLTVSLQSWLWSAGYVGFFVTCGWCAWNLMRHERLEPASAAAQTAVSNTSRPSLSSLALWIALPACASAMLLATTNLITQDIAAIPLLWVAPLCIYLLSFILCFQSDGWYHRGVFHGLYVVAFLLAMQELMIPWGVHVLLQLGTCCLALFAVCMVCHGELARSKPAASHLSTFYFMLSAGGALGSLFVVLIAPRLFKDIGEFPLVLLACGGLLLVAVALDRRSWIYTKRAYRAVALVGVVLLMLQGYRYSMERIQEHARGKLVFRTRNFFGVKRVEEDATAFWLLHGKIVHGVQLKDAQLHDQPTLYFKHSSGVGLLLTNYPRPAQPGTEGLRVGIVGLGAGTLASYGKAGDYFRFYEIDPQVVALSRAQNPAFTFVKDSPAKIDIMLGDARLLLADEAARGQLQKFDVLVLDAFSGDAIPVHLLTREAMGLYLRHLSGPNAVMAFHLTNRSVDLAPVFVGLSKAYNLTATQVDDSYSKWVLVSANPQMLSLQGLEEHTRPVETGRTIPQWTDEYSNLFEVMSTN